MAPREAGHVTMRRVGTLGFGLFGSLAYLAAHDGARIEEHCLIGWDERLRHLPAAAWVERVLRDQPRRSRQPRWRASSQRRALGSGWQCCHASPGSRRGSQRLTWNSASTSRFGSSCMPISPPPPASAPWPTTSANSSTAKTRA